MEASSLVGDWDLYAQGMHSEIHLDASGNYVHSLWGLRKHWGTWSLENQNGYTYLVLQLADGLPRVGAGLFPWTQVSWPTYEAWPIIRGDGDTVVLQNALMHRKAESVPAVPAFVPPQPIAPLPVPPVPPPPPPAFSFPSIPFPAAPPGAAQPGIPQSILDQWKDENANWNKAREIMAQTFVQDLSETNSVNQMYAAESQKEQNQQRDNMIGIEKQSHTLAKNFIQYIKSK